MNFGIEGKVALVVGGSKGMGRATCEHLAAEGCRIAVVARKQDAIDATVDRCKEIGGDALGVAEDCTAQGAADRILHKVERIFGSPDILIYNVEMGYNLNFSSASGEDYIRGNNTLVLSYADLVRRSVPGMRDRRWGRVINISSAAVKQVGADVSLVVDVTYRHAAAALSKMMSKELAPHGITVNTVGPGSVETETHKAFSRAYAAEHGMSENDVRDALQSRIPLGRLGSPEEFGAVCAFLCSQQAGYVNGQTILVDGGRYLGF